MGEYMPKAGDVVVAKFEVTRAKPGCYSLPDYKPITTTKTRSVFGSVQRVTPKRVLVQTLKTSFLGFSKRDVWVPAESVRLASSGQAANWRKAMKECDDLVRAFRDAHVEKSRG